MQGGPVAEHSRRWPGQDVFRLETAWSASVIRGLSQGCRCRVHHSRTDVPGRPPGICILSVLPTDSGTAGADTAGPQQGEHGPALRATSERIPASATEGASAPFRSNYRAGEWAGRKA